MKKANVFLIENLADFNCRYYLYRVRGISRSSDLEEYYRDTQDIVNRLSRQTHSPCITYGGAEELLIAQPEGYSTIPESLDVRRGKKVKFEQEAPAKELRFDSLDQNTLPLTTRFLQFAFQDPLHKHPLLWQPHAGSPYYHKSPDRGFQSMTGMVDMYRGFTFRVVPFAGSLGLCVDTSSKYVSRNTLPTKITREESQEYIGMNCLYEYGDDWYEIRIYGWNGLAADELELPDGSTLFADVHRKAGRFKSQNLLSLPRDCSVLTYRNSRNEERNVPSGLCRRTFTTDHPEIEKLHNMTLKPPGERMREIGFVTDSYLRKLTFNGVGVHLSQEPIAVPSMNAKIPTLAFGHGKTLSVAEVGLRDFGRKKKELLFSSSAGPYVKKALDRQYFILPRSVYETFGRAFIADIKREADRLLQASGDGQYDPIVVPYDDSVQKSVYNLGRQIVNAVDDIGPRRGFGIVMIPTVRSARISEDELANLLVKELREREIHVSIIHTTVAAGSYEFSGNEGEADVWTAKKDNDTVKRIRGYVRGVVVNKILLPNSIWPFVLNDQLRADLTIGIDVKNHVAGITFVYKTGADVRFFTSETKDKEQLSAQHLRKKIVEFIRDEREFLSGRSVRKIVIHRQGRVFETEKRGIKDALEIVASDGLIPKNYECTFVEIKSTSKTPLRLFDFVTVPHEHNGYVRNPVVGSYVCEGNEAFICNTGFPYSRPGTVHPLHVSKIEGAASMEDVVNDVFALANLTWSKVDDCSREPLSVKMTDYRLRESAGEYDKDSFEFVPDADGGEGDE